MLKNSNYVVSRFRAEIFDEFIMVAIVSCLHECSQHYVEPYKVRMAWLKRLEELLCRRRDITLDEMSRSLQLTWRQRILKRLGFRVVFARKYYANVYDDQLNEFLELMRHNLRDACSALETEARGGKHEGVPWNVEMKGPQIDPKVPTTSPGATTPSEKK